MSQIIARKFALFPGSLYLCENYNVLKKLATILLCFVSLSVSAQSVGLVLSGGGAKGITHIGVIHALEDNGIPIDYIAGSSIGAVIGSLYAVGYSPDEMFELITSPRFRQCYSGSIDEDDVYFVKKNGPSPEFFNVRSAIGDSLDFSPTLPTNLVNPIYMNIVLPELFAQATAACNSNFDSLFVPFRCVATDVYEKESVVFSQGDLGDAVRASMTFPFVFKPIEHEGQLLYDGGILNNFPADIMKRDFHPDFTIGSVVTQNSEPPSDDDLIGQLEAMIMERSNYALSDSSGILLSFDNLSKEVSLLDFSQAQRLHDLGYAAASAIVDSIRRQVPRTISSDEIALRRSLFRAAFPPLLFRNITISGAGEHQSRYVMNEIRGEEDATFSMEDFRRGYFCLLSDNSISEIRPTVHYNSSDETFDLHLDVNVHDYLTLSLGGAITTGNINEIYFGMCYDHVGRRSAQIMLNGQVGRPYNAVGLETRLDILGSELLSLRLIGNYSTLDYYKQDYLFSGSSEQSLNKQQELFAKFKVALPFLSHQKAELGVGVGRLVDGYIPGSTLDLSNLVYDRNEYRLLGGSLYFGGNSLNSPQYATTGLDQHFIAQVFTGNNHYLPGTADELDSNTPLSWIQMGYLRRGYQPLGERFALGSHVEAFYSSRSLDRNFTATMMQACAFAPTPSMSFTYNSFFRSDIYAAAGLMPVYSLSNIFHVRLETYAFLPLCPVLQTADGGAMYGQLLSRWGHIEELSIVGRFSTIVASAYLHHDNSPQNPWLVGISIGWQLLGNRFIER